MADMNGTSNHRVLLWDALELTCDAVIEFGSGHGSTAYLKEYCKDNNRTFKSYENNAEWAGQTGAELIDNWDSIQPESISILFIDHAPGERRKKDIVKWKDHAQIIVVHDTEIAADHGYQMRQHFELFDSAVEINADGGGAGAAMLSNFVDLSHLISSSWEQYIISSIQNSKS